MSDAQSTRAGHDLLSTLTLAAGVLVCAIPVLLVVGKAPPDIALSVVALLFLVHSGRAHDWSWLRTPWVTVALGLWLYLIVASTVADDTSRALERAAPWGRFIIFAAALQHWILADATWRKRLLVCTGALLAFVAADTFYQYFVGHDIFGIPKYSDNRLTGPMPEMPPKVGIYVMRIMFPVLLVLPYWAAAERRNLLANIAAAAAVWLGVATVLISGERTALLLTLFGLTVAVVLMPAAKRALMAVILAAGIGAAGVFALDKTVFSRSVESTVETVESFWQSHYGQIWLSTLRIAGRNPVFGIGLKNFRTECPEPAYGQTEDVDARCDMHPHNMYLEWLSETGVIGLGGFLWLIGLWIRHFIAGARYWRHEGAAVGLVVAVTTYLWPVAAAMSFFTNWRAAVFWLVLGWALAATGDKPSAPAPAHTTS